MASEARVRGVPVTDYGTNPDIWAKCKPDKWRYFVMACRGSQGALRHLLRFPLSATWQTLDLSSRSKAVCADRLSSSSLPSRFSLRDAIRDRIRRQVYATVHGDGLDYARYDRPDGDPGLFGPDSMVWLVHGDMPGMFTGGIAALLLQSLHPLAMAGVDQHSDYRERPIDRLNGTAGFVTVTSYGGAAEAEAAIARVRRIHEHVRGTAPDGRPYGAGDPELLRWVHVAETGCFLAGYQRYAPRPLTRSEQDRYFAEVALLAERLGATDVPHSLAEVHAYLAEVRPQLALTEAASAAVDFLRTPGTFASDPGSAAAMRILVNGGIDLLPDWARAQLRLPARSALGVTAVRASVRALAAALRYGCEPSDVITTARARALRPAPSAGRTSPPDPH
jgi:uncharacterized protein (DUF2236 family)